MTRVVNTSLLRVFAEPLVALFAENTPGVAVGQNTFAKHLDRTDSFFDEDPLPHHEIDDVLLGATIYEPPRFQGTVVRLAQIGVRGYDLQ